MNINHIQNNRYPLKKTYNTSNANTRNPLENVANQTKSAPILFIAGFILLLLLIFILRLLYNEGTLFRYTGLNKSQSSVVNEILIILSVVFAVFFILVLFFPSMKEFGGFLTNISSSFLCILYTFFLLYCLYTIPTNTMTKYASTLVPFFLFLTFFVFSGALLTSFTTSNPMYNQINTIILFFCFLTTVILFYTVDPGNYISSNFGYLSLISMLIGIFGFVYLLILFIVPSGTQNSNNNNSKSVFETIALNMNITTIISAAIFLLFSLLITIGIIQYPGGFFSQENVWSSLTITFLLSLVFSILSILFISRFSSTTSFAADSKMGLFKTSLLSVFGIVISALLITWLVFGIEGLTGKSGILSFVLNAFLVIILLIFIYKSLNVQVPGANSGRENTVSLFLKTFFFIPCLFSNGLDGLTKLFTDKDSFDKYSSIILIVLFIVFFYFLTNIQETIASSPIFNDNLSNQSVLLLEPIPLNISKSIGSYEELNKYTIPSSGQHNYQYAISFWFFIEAEPTQSAYNQYKSLMNYGNKPEVLYRHADNSLLVTMERNGIREIDFPTTTDSKNEKDPLTLEKMDEYENDGIYENSRILYKREKIQLQRWNHLLLNYVNGTLDIFYNGKLVKTAVGLVPYMSLDRLTTGADHGIQGNICNVVYYNKSLTLKNIHQIYESVKHKNPPI